MKNSLKTKLFKNSLKTKLFKISGQESKTEGRQIKQRYVNKHLSMTKTCIFKCIEKLLAQFYLKHFNIQIGRKTRLNIIIY